MARKLALVAICLACLGGSALAQDAKTVIANAQKALGDVKSITYSGSAKDVAFQQCGANSTDMVCRGTHDPMRPINNYVRVIDLTAPASRHTGATNNIGPGGSTTLTPGMFFAQVTPQQADVSQPWAGSLEFYITPWGFLKGAAENNATATRRNGHTVLTWSPSVKAPSGKSYVISGYVNDKNLIDRVETWLGENIMGDMEIVATYSGWKDFGGVMAPTKIVQTRGGWPFFDVDVTSAKANPSDVATLVPPPAPAGGRGGGAGGAGRGAPPALTVTTERLGDGLYRLTTGAGSYDSIIVEFKDYVMMLEAGQPEARAIAYVAETKKLIPNKPIRYVWNSHPHADHTGGLPVLVAEGATI
ncbi:MAG TPA: MBL fold metallo-hydrolase, partial [Vicinamibacterales bacterium]|nr:MBL fold metallo-hydrolase [Vicinamibacterales bacterium]